MSIPLTEELGRGRYGVLLCKKFPQRPEHVATYSRIFTKMYPKIHKHIHFFKAIPSSLFEVVRIIDLKGGKYDGTSYGEYALTVRPRGAGAGRGRFVGGCDLFYNGIKVVIGRTHGEEKVYCNDYWFLKLISLQERHRVNFWLKNR